MALLLTCLHTRHAKSSAAHSASEGARWVATSQRSRRRSGGAERRVGLLREDAARDGPQHELGRRGPGGLRLWRVREQAPVLLLAEEVEHAVLVVGRDDELGEHGVDGLGRGAVQRPVDDDDAAEGRDGVGREGAAVRLVQRLGARHAARVGVLQDRDGRLRVTELADEVQRGREVEEVVGRELLAVERLVGRAVGVEGGALVRVLAVAQRQRQRQRDRERVGHVTASGVGLVVGTGFVAARGLEEARDGVVVVGGVAEGRGGEAPPRGERERAAVRVELVGERVVVRRVHDGRDGAEVLGRRAEHGRPADVDVLGRHRVVGARGHGLPKRVQVDGDELDRADAVLVQRGLVVGVVGAREDPAVNARVERSSRGRRGSRGSPSPRPRRSRPARRRGGRAPSRRWRAARRRARRGAARRARARSCR